MTNRDHQLRVSHAISVHRGITIQAFMQFIEDETISHATKTTKRLYSSTFCNIAFFSVRFDQELRIDA